MRAQIAGFGEQRLFVLGGEGDVERGGAELAGERGAGRGEQMRGCARRPSPGRTSSRRPVTGVKGTAAWSFG